MNLDSPFLLRQLRHPIETVIVRRDWGRALEIPRRSGLRIPEVCPRTGTELGALLELISASRERAPAQHEIALGETEGLQGRAGARQSGYFEVIDRTYYLSKL